MITKRNKTIITLQDLMTNNKISLRSLARQIALSPSMLSRMINGKRKFRYEHKIKVALVLRKDIKEIIWPGK
jgi:transcriptional regulator with XRE-family HTH domain